MKMLKENMEALLLKVSYSRKSEYEDKELNDFFNYWFVFEEKEDDILRLKDESIDSMLYTKYYWCTKYKKRYEELYGYDAGIEQQQYKLIEELQARINETVNWSLLESMEVEQNEIL